MATNNSFELSTGVGRLRDIDQTWIPYYDTVYLGDPFCDLFAENLLINRGHLEEAITILKEHKKKVYLSTPVEPWTDEADETRDIIAHALELGVDGIEVLNEGILYMVATEFPGTDMHMNSFIRAFNSSAVNGLAEYGASRVAPYYELSLDEICKIKANCSVQFEILVHGHIPLGNAELCMIHPQRVARQEACTGDCYDNFIMRHSNKDFSMQAGGRLTLSGKDVCMLHKLPMLIDKGFQLFRIESRLHSSIFRQFVGQTYRECLEKLTQGEKPDLNCSVLAEQSPEGFCNGYYFEKPGSHFIE